ncbi:hypothetical protein [Hymenobacter fodinae]|uniref:Uncharacterized protein n=1 Tax=Hymenobacter fodinae TaxID=2510796 RepID=A0A4Z0PCW2_9BACT|nr:hypothetical protein [Hymenobacter fodinae]TGE10484.1 hypothetical protein EU556_06640 [Hymenobacter fodinae]
MNWRAFYQEYSIPLKINGCLIACFGVAASLAVLTSKSQTVSPGFLTAFIITGLVPYLSVVVNLCMGAIMLAKSRHKLARAYFAFFGSYLLFFLVLRAV